jgi:hypothetical protein
LRRLHLIEFHELAICPAEVRNTLTDLLQFSISLHATFAPVQELLSRAVQNSKSRLVVDLCSGGGGPWGDLDAQVPVRLTDKFPNVDAFTKLSGVTGKRVSFETRSIDASAVSIDLRGFRTLFSSYHHFKPEQARAILRDAVAQGQGIAVFEFTRRDPRAIAQMLLSPPCALAGVPFLRPFRWMRLFWTYIVPLVPLLLTLDGIVSCLRTYSLQELREMTRDFPSYDWQISEVSGKRWPVPITCLIGLPRQEAPKRLEPAEQPPHGIAEEVGTSEAVETVMVNGEAH